MTTCSIRIGGKGESVGPWSVELYFCPVDDERALSLCHFPGGLGRILACDGTRAVGTVCVLNRMDAEASRSIGDNVQTVYERLRQAALAVRRRADSVRLVAATKSISVEAIREGLAAGLNILGENRLQEALPKIEVLRGEPVRWHFIGRLQRRKVRSVVGRFDLIHSVDTLELAREIHRRAKDAGYRQAVLLEVNID